MRIKKSFFITALVCLCLTCAGCGSKAAEPDPAPTSVTFAAGEFPLDIQELNIVLKEGETALLDNLGQLKSADFSGSSCIEEIFLWAQSNPQVDVRYSVTLPDGSAAYNDERSIDLSQAVDADINALASSLPYLTELESIELGTERPGLSWDGIDQLYSMCQGKTIKYVFNLYGKDTDLQNTQINLSHIEIDDGGAAVKKVMAYMPNLSYLDMDSCGVSDEDMAAIRDAYPDVKVVWRVWFGDNGSYSVRTDTERILASKASVGGMLTPENTTSLKYCTDVKYLDVGHNDWLTDISFVSYMPDLEVAILAMDFWTDASPLASCTKLEYLEMQTTCCTDLSPLSALTNLKHLNVAHIDNLSDVSPLFGLTGLERLWLGCWNKVPKEQVQELVAALPNTEVNTTAYADPTEGRWRYTGYNDKAYFFYLHPRYELLREQFGGYADSAFSFWWNDPLY